MGFLAALPAIATAGAAIYSAFKKNKTPKTKAQSLLRPEQEPLFQQAVNAGLQPGAGGAFGESADYYRSILGDNPQQMGAFYAPHLRQYNEEIVPGLAEQFAGMGAGGLSSSGFRNAQIQGAVDLTERLAAIRAQLRQASAQGLTNIGQIGLNPYSENVRNTPQPGFNQYLAQGVGRILPEVAASYLKQPTPAAAAPAAATPAAS